RESDSLINWAYSANREKKTYNIPEPNKDNPTIQGRYGVNGLNFSSLFYLNGRLFLFAQESPIDTNPTGYRDPSAPKFAIGMRYYSVDVNKDTSDNNNWVEHKFPLREGRNSAIDIFYESNKLYVRENGNDIYYEYIKINDNVWGWEDVWTLAADASKIWS
ncbi:hypothetical protein EZH24_13395, partial [Brachyspira catarrhinii]